MKASIPFAEGLSVPRQIATSKMAVLAATGAGKSNVGAVLAEELSAASIPFTFVCPKGDSWGLGSKGPGGPGLPIAIFGGHYGDVPLEEGSAEPLATFIAEKGVSSVVDVSDFPSDAARTRFLTRFAQALYRKNRSPLHLILDEAHDYLPQKPVRPEHPLCLHAWEKLVKWGRTHGIGVTLISQRSASLNKEVLTQVETLVVLRTSGPRDRKAIREWLEDKELSVDLVQSLPKLATGEAWIWSPHFLALDEPKRVRFRQRRTFDSGATPLLGERKKVPTRADVDLVALKEQFRSEIVKAEADDPKALKTKLASQAKEISILQTKLAAAEQGTQSSRSAVDRKLSEKAIGELRDLREAVAALRELLVSHNDDPGQQLGYIRGAFEAVSRELAELSKRFETTDLRHRLSAMLSKLEQRGHALAGTVDAPPKTAEKASPPVATPGGSTPGGPGFFADSRLPRTPKPTLMELLRASRAENGGGDPKAGARLMLSTLTTLHPAACSRRTLGLLTGLPSRGSTFSVYLSSLRRHGYVVEYEDGMLGATEEGRAYAQGATVHIDSLRPEAVIGRFDRKLKAGARAMLRHLVQSYPEAVSREALGTAVGLPHTGSTFSVYLSSLRRKELIDEEKGEGLRAAEGLMAFRASS